MKIEGECKCSDTSGTINYTSKPACYKSKCDECQWKNTCINADKGCYAPIPYIPYYPGTPTYPQGPIWWCYTATNSKVKE